MQVAMDRLVLEVQGPRIESAPGNAGGVKSDPAAAVLLLLVFLEGAREPLEHGAHGLQHLLCFLERGQLVEHRLALVIGFTRGHQ